MTDVPHRNGHGWRNAAIGGFGGVCLLFAGWMLTEVSTERRALETIANENRSRIAVLESEVRSLKTMVYEMRREQLEKR